eukprot:471021-Alexandrium_andersonii.AAC.1
MNRIEDLATGVGGRPQVPKDGLAQLTVAVQELKTQAGSSTGKPAYAGAPAPGGVPSPSFRGYGEYGSWRSS